MHRVLKPGGRAKILDLRRDASSESINAAVKAMKLGWFSALLTRWIFKHSLLKRAYAPEDFQRMAGQAPFGRCEVQCDGITLVVTLRK